MGRKRLLKAVLATAVLLASVAGLWWALSTRPPEPNPLQISFAGLGSREQGTIKGFLSPAGSVPDDLRLKYPPERRADFYLTSTQECAIAVLATGVQILTPAGWSQSMEEYRGETWRLKPGVLREFCVERPASGTWRAYVRYAKEIKGLTLLKARLHEAWVKRSFTNWSGRAWGGGRFSGQHELFSELMDP